jgi:hypothetical protein
MPSLLHDALVELLQASPEVAIELARVVAEIPAFDAIVSQPTDFLQHVPPARGADAAFRLVDGAGRSRMGLIVEVQETIDPKKRWS